MTPAQLLDHLEGLNSVFSSVRVAQRAGLLPVASYKTLFETDVFILRFGV